ncbi:RidA family protein [Paenibacillus sp.]|uniref:RidA family protein n=1 Tax=Paenibacillus sp. TaxID=58172 RepID=UPI002D325A62|nr:RidA family protein [Paenibacillus sp.]HZG58505.1 RidA family protein [Paenibacillus sp.]
MSMQEKLSRLGLSLPAPIVVPPNVAISFEWVRISGNRAYLSGHSALNPDGTLYPLFGKVGKEVSYEDAYQFARQTALAMLSTLQEAIGDLDRITAWVAANGYVNALPGEVKTTYVMNGFSDLILELFGQEIGRHARTAIGVESLPMNLPLVISAQVDFQ